MQLCIQCHVRKPNDQNRVAVLDPNRLALLKPLFRADWYAAARHFDEALLTYQDVIKDQNLVRTNPQEWQEAAQRALAISVRAKGDPDQSEKIVDSILNTTNAPHYFLARAQLWKDQIHEWKSNTLRIKLRGSDYDKAIVLMQIARQKAPTSGDYSNSYILYLRASSYLHSYLQQISDPIQTAKAYLLLGQCYEVLKDPGEVGLSKNYYKSCILSAPHTETAIKCFDRYEERTYVDALGGETAIPLSTVDYMDYLKNMASP